MPGRDFSGAVLARDGGTSAIELRIVFLDFFGVRWKLLCRREG